MFCYNYASILSKISNLTHTLHSQKIVFCVSLRKIVFSIKVISYSFTPLCNFPLSISGLQPQPTLVMGNDLKSCEVDSNLLKIRICRLLQRLLINSLVVECLWRFAPRSIDQAQNNPFRTFGAKHIILVPVPSRLKVVSLVTGVVLRESPCPRHCRVLRSRFGRSFC